MKTILLALLLCISVSTYAQRVEQVEASVADGKIRVTCMLQTNSKQDLSLLYSADGGATFNLCRTVTGDLAGQSQGPKQFLWDCGKDGIIMGDFVFKVEYKPSAAQPEDNRNLQDAAQTLNDPVRTPPREAPAVHGNTNEWKGYTLLMPGVVLSNNTSYSLMAGYVKRFGGYARIKSNFISKGEKKQTGNNDDDDDDDDDNDNDDLDDAADAKKGRLSVMGGVVYGLTRSLYLYGGIGYAEKWAKDYSHIEEYSYSCLEVEAGLIYRIGNFSVSGGVGYLTKKSDIEANIAVGFMF